MIFTIDLVYTKRNTFFLKCFIQFTCTNLDGSQKEGVGMGNFLNFLQKERGTQKGRGVPSEKGGGSDPGGNYDVALSIFISQSAIAEEID